MPPDEDGTNYILLLQRKGMNKMSKFSIQSGDWAGMPIGRKYSYYPFFTKGNCPPNTMIMRTVDSRWRIESFKKSLANCHRKFLSGTN